MKIKMFNLRDNLQFRGLFVIVIIKKYKGGFLWETKFKK